MSLVSNVYSATSSFPKTEQFGLTNQMRRCAVSIPSNIAEGYGRQSTADYIRFLRMARGSTYELETQIQIADNLEYLPESDGRNLRHDCNQVAAMLNALLTRLESKSSPIA